MGRVSINAHIGRLDNFTKVKEPRKKHDSNVPGVATHGRAYS